MQCTEEKKKEKKQKDNFENHPKWKMVKNETKGDRRKIKIK